MFLTNEEQVFLRGQRLQMKKNALVMRSYNRCLDVLAEREIGADTGSELRLARALQVSRTMLRALQARLKGEGLIGGLIGMLTGGLIGSVLRNRFFDHCRGATSLIFHDYCQWNRRDATQRNLVAVHEHLAINEGLQSRDLGRAHRACQDHVKSARRSLLVAVGMAENN